MLETTREKTTGLSALDRTYDREWALASQSYRKSIAISGINRMLKWLKDSTVPPIHSAVIVTECFEKYAAYPQNIKWALTMREIFERVTSISGRKSSLSVSLRQFQMAHDYPEFQSTGLWMN